MRIGTLYRTLLAASSSRARVFGFAVVALVELGVAGLLSSQSLADRTATAAQLVDKFGLTLVIPLAALVFGTASLGDPIEDGTYVYLWLRPFGRWQLTLAAYLATLTSVIPLAVLPTVAGGLVIDHSSSMARAAVAASLVTAFAYSAVFVLLGHLTARALIWGVAYLLILEQFIARGGSGLGFISVHSHAVSVLARLLDRHLQLDYFSLATAVVVPVCFILAWLGWSMVRQNRMSVA